MININTFLEHLRFCLLVAPLLKFGKITLKKNSFFCCFDDGYGKNEGILIYRYHLKQCNVLILI